MAARTTKLTALLLGILCLLTPQQSVHARSEGSQRANTGQRPSAPPTRIVSLVPALTEMLFAIGAGSQVIGVSSFDAFPPEVQKLPRVGALLDPDTERILALRPQLIIVYASQTDTTTRFERAGIRTLAFRHAGIAGVLDAIRNLGEVTGHSNEAARLATDIQRRIDAVRMRVKGRARPRTLLVLGRDPATLRSMYVSGGVGFMHEMLDAAGGTNVFGDSATESVQPSHEVLLARAPEAILEIHAAGLTGTRAADEGRRAWSTLPSIPAVRNGRIHVLTGDYLVVPGPRLAMAVESFARTLHPDVFR